MKRLPLFRNKGSQCLYRLRGQFIGEDGLFKVPAAIMQNIGYGSIEMVADVVAQQVEHLLGIATWHEFIACEGDAVEVFVILNKSKSDKFFEHAAWVYIASDRLCERFEARRRTLPFEHAWHATKVLILGICCPAGEYLGTDWRFR